MNLNNKPIVCDEVQWITAHPLWVHAKQKSPALQNMYIFLFVILRPPFRYNNHVVKLINLSEVEYESLMHDGLLP